MQATWNIFENNVALSVNEPLTPTHISADPGMNGYLTSGLRHVPVIRRASGNKVHDSDR